MSLRVRIVIVVLLAAVVPLAAVAWHAPAARRATTAYLDEESRAALAYDATLDAEEGRRTRLAVDGLCDGDYVMDALVADVAAGRFDAQHQADVTARLPALARAQGLASLELLSPDGRLYGRVPVPQPSPGRTRFEGERIARDALAAGDRVYDGRAACVLGTGDARIVVVGTATPVPRPAAVDPGPLSRAWAADVTTSWVAIGATAILALLLGLWLARGVAGSLRTIQLAAARIGQGAMDSSHSGKARGEVGKTLAALDAMTVDLQKAQRRALRAERVAAWRDIARRIAHEIKNPLSPIQTSIETMRKTYAKKHPDFDEIFEESTLTILEEVERLKHIVEEFSRFARMPRPRAEELDVRDVIAHVESLAPANDVPLRVELAASLPRIRADRDQLVQVLVNLVQNAADAARSKDPSTARVTLVGEDWEKGRGVVLSVRDNGPGIPASERQNVFEPYYTTKTGGTGLGLAIVHRIVVDHRGTVEIDEARDGSGGAEVRVTLPVEGPGEAADSSMTDGSLSQL